MVPKVSQGAFTPGLLRLFPQKVLLIEEGSISAMAQKKKSEKQSATPKFPQIHRHASSPSFLNRLVIFNSVFC